MGVLNKSEIQKMHEKYIGALLECNAKNRLENDQFWVIFSMLNYFRKINNWTGWIEIPLDFLKEESKLDSFDDLDYVICSLDKLGLIQVRANGTQFKLNLIEEV